MINEMEKIRIIEAVDRLCDYKLEYWIDEYSESLVKTLSERKMHISCAESCTAGLVAAAIGSVPGASDVMEASFVTYSEAAKARFANVSMDTIRTYGVVSPQVAQEMAGGVLRYAGLEYGVGIGITGYAGPSGEQPGRVCIGIRILQEDPLVRNEDVYCGIDHVFTGSRNIVRQKAAATALIFAFLALV